MPSQNPNRALQFLRQFTVTLFQEHLDPGHAAWAVFLGVFVATVPIYGFQTVAVIGLATLFRLNKPVAFAATFINNPILQPFLIVGGLELGHFILTGRFARLSLPHSVSDLKSQLGAWFIGSVILGIILGAISGFIIFVILSLRSKSAVQRREHARFVNSLFSGRSNFDRGFVRWKLRLDRIFDVLAVEDPGSGTVVDLGCGYGIALAFSSFHHDGRRLLGCDLDAHRIETARTALCDRNAELRVSDVRKFDFPEASLILIFDVLQYLPGPEQLALLQRCASALLPGGKLIFRVPDRGSKATSRLSIVFDRLIFYLGKTQAGPIVLSAEEIQSAFNLAELQVEHRRMRNRLPLTHRLFIVSRPTIG
jgi:uncharacterized protein (DUF2062 family)